MKNAAAMAGMFRAMPWTSMVATMGAVLITACGGTTGGGGVGAAAGSGGAAGSLCNPATVNQGCFNGVKMACAKDSTSATGGKWSLLGTCDNGTACTETADPTDTSAAKTKKLASCQAAGGTGTDATSGGSDATTGGSDTSTGGQDTGGGVLGSCGDGYCNTGETAANCPADCGGGGGTGAVCGNGTCEAGETKANCAKDCNTVTNPCNNDGTCDAGETTANCPGDCPTGGTTDPTACLQSKCANEYNACGTDQACVTLVNCLGKCTSSSDTACINACAQASTQTAITEYQNLGTCGDTNGCFAGSGGGTTPSCGDGTCDAGETKANCPADCGGGTTTGHICDKNCGATTTVGGGCYCDDQCNMYGDCCDAAGSAPSQANPHTDCAGSTCAACNGSGGGTTTPVCGNGTCETGETTATCPGDCPASGGGTCTPYTDVQQIFVDNCNGCHGHKFGNGCSSASNYSAINSYVQSGQMPPSGGLTAAEKAAIASWAKTKNVCTASACP